MLFTIFAIYLSLLFCSCCYEENRQHDQYIINHLDTNDYDYDMIDDDSGDDMFDDGFGSD